GYRLGPLPHTMLPTYPPGLPALMALATVAGVCGPFLVVPACGGLLVWCTFVLGRRAAGPLAGVLAALVVGASPVLLMLSPSPITDVPSGAFWTAALAAALAGSRRSAIAAGAGSVRRG